MDTKRQVGARISAVRKQRKLTQEELAAKLERSVDAISNIERGKSYPSFEMIEGLVGALGVDVSTLVLGRPRVISASRAALEAELVAICDQLSDEDLRLAVDQIGALRRARL